MAIEQQRNVANNLQFWLSTTNFIVAAGLFSVLFEYKFQVLSFFGAPDYIEFVRSILGDFPQFLSRCDEFIAANGPALLLFGATFLLYLSYRGAVSNELEIMKRLFSRLNLPADWHTFPNRAMIPVLAILLVLTFVALAWFSDELLVYSVVFSFLHLLDYRGNKTIRVNLKRYFLDSQYAPAKNDPAASFVIERRKVAEDYWIRRPQLSRIVLMFLATMAAFGMTVCARWFDSSLSPNLPYLILVGIVALNWLTMVMWRRPRDAQLDDIDQREFEFERALHS